MNTIYYYKLLNTKALRLCVKQKIKKLLSIGHCLIGHNNNTIFQYIFINH
jgi:hypothetical protein